MSFKKILLLIAVVALALPASALAAPKSKFRFERATTVATEGQHTVAVTITRTARHGHSRINQASSVNWSITGGTATNGVDYTVDRPQGKIDFKSGDSSETLTFTINQDTEIEGLESINLNLSAASNNALITQPRTAQVLIADDDGPTQISLVPASQSVNEGIGTAQLYAIRSGDITGSTSLHYATSDGTAVAPGDYTAQSGDFSYGVGDFSKTINVPIVDDTTIENPETFNATLSNLTGATFANHAQTASAAVTIVDNDSPPVFALDASSYEVNEDGSVDVTVNRLGNASAPNAVSANDVFDVAWMTSDGTAMNPADYYPGADQTLEFDSTDDAETITIAANDPDTQVTLVDDSLVEGDETFGLGLQSTTIEPGGSGVQPSLGSPSSSTVTIHDNDTATGGGSVNAGGAGGNGGTSNGSGTGSVTDQGNQLVLGARQAACGLVAKAAAKQKLLRQRGLKLRLRAGQLCKVTVTTSIKQLRAHSHKRHAQIVRALLLKGKKASLTLQPGKAKTVQVRFTKKTLKAITKALRGRKQLVATIVVTTRDSASKVSRKTLKITIGR